MARAVLFAESELENDTSAEPEEKIEDDWLNRWRNEAGEVSNEQLQILWGKLLAGELKSPGTISLRTLDFLRNLSQADAELIQKLAPFVAGKYIFRDAASIFEDAGISFEVLLEYQQMGVVSGTEAIGLTSTWSSSVADRFVTVLANHDLALLISGDDAGKSLKLPVYQITSVGRQILGLGTFRSPSGYLESVGERIKAQGFTVDIGTFKISARGFELVNPRRL